MLSIDEADDKILAAAFTNGLRKGKFLFSLYKNDPKTMSEVLYRATKFMNVEDAFLAREEKPKKRDRQEDVRQERGQKTTRFTNFTPLTTPDRSSPDVDQGRHDLDVARQVKGRS